MKIAIIGAGFAGIATAWNILDQAKDPLVHVIVYDPHGLGGQASGIAAGLLHKYSGPFAKLSRHGIEGFAETQQLLDLASKELTERAYIKSGLLRPALTAAQIDDYQNTAKSYPGEIRWLNAAECQEYVPLMESYPGIFIDSALTVFPDLYLEGLWRLCEKKGAILEKRKIEHLEDLSGHDYIVIAAGAGSTSFSESANIKATYVKGQILEFEWPDNLEPLTVPVNSQVYTVMSRDKKTCLVGATYEREYTHSEPDLELTKENILPKAVRVLPLIADLKLVGCKAGFRVSAKDHLPIIQKINEKCWVFSGLGSKGLLYHALYAKQLAQIILSRNL